MICIVIKVPLSPAQNNFKRLIKKLVLPLPDGATMHILKGNLNSVISVLKNLMQEYAANFQFELAHEIKQKIEIIEQYRSKSNIVSKAFAGNQSV